MNILFLCAGHSCRSIIAEAVSGKLALDEIKGDPDRLSAELTRIGAISGEHALQSQGERR